MVFRLDPALPVQAYRTFEITSPISTHYRDGTCDEAGCLAQRNGWTTTVDEASELGQRQAHYVRRLSARKFAEERTAAGLTVFTFEAGQRCFAGHKVPLDRPEFYAVRSGDWRSLGRPRLATADGWVNEFAENQERIARVVNG